MDTSNDTRTCTNCNRVFPVTAEYFYSTKKTKLGLTAWCKTCCSERAGHVPLKRIPTGLKRCPSCKVVFKATSEWFHLNAGSRDGLANYCKSCACETRRNHYRSTHPVKALLSDTEKVERRKAARLRWKTVHPKEFKASRRTYKINRAARIRGNGGRHTKADLKRLFEQQGGLCYWCNKPIQGKSHVDHIIAVSKGGGSNIENLCFSCSWCNQHKSNAPLEKWLRKLQCLQF